VLKLGGPFSRTWRLRGLQRFLEDVAEDEPFARLMTDRMTDHLVVVGTAAVERLDWPRVQLHIADDFASTFSPLMSPAAYARVFLPNLRRMVDAFHRLGFRVSYESEGNIIPMLGLLDEAGVDGLAHMEPRAGMEIGGIRKRFGSRFFVMGNVCNTRVLPSNDRKAIAREVRRVLGAAVDGGYLGLSAHSIGPDVSSDAYDWFFALMDRYGRYPIRLGELEREC
jgi:uroporphyrinogen decarboxylase